MPAGMVGQMFDGQELQHLVGPGAQRAFLVGDPLAAEPGAPQRLAPIARAAPSFKFSRQIIEWKLVRDLKVRNRPLENSTCGFRPGDVFAIPMITVPLVGRQHAPR